jgi:sensor domain CHASE-containing protein
MRLRSKTTLTILIIWALTFAVTYLGSRTILLDSYIHLENDQATNHINRTLQAIDQMAEGVGLIASSNAVWDDAYNFAADKN